jgi:hypothetical protein
MIRRATTQAVTTRTVSFTPPHTQLHFFTSQLTLLQRHSDTNVRQYHATRLVLLNQGTSMTKCPQHSTAVYDHSARYGTALHTPTMLSTALHTPTMHYTALHTATMLYTPRYLPSTCTALDCLRTATSPLVCA